MSEPFNRFLKAWRDWLLRNPYEFVRKEQYRFDEQLETLTKRMDDLEAAYAADPRRAEIAKEKAEQPNHIAGFTPRSKRIAAWEGQRKAEPKKG